MAGKQTLYFPCPGCGARFARVEEPDEDIHAGETYTCTECGARVVFVALSMEMLADPRQHPVGLPLLQARTLPVGPVQRRAGRLNRRLFRVTLSKQQGGKT